MEPPKSYDFVPPTPPARQAVAPETQRQIEQQLAAGIHTCPMCGQPVKQQQQTTRQAPTQGQQRQYSHVPASPPAGRGFGEVQQQP